MYNLLEKTLSTEAAKESALNQFRGKVNELAFIHYMREHIAKIHGHDMREHDKHPLKFLSPEEREEHSFNSKFLSPEETHAQHKRAQAQVEAFLEHSRMNGYHHPTHVHHTAFEGDIGRVTGHKQSQTENPSDALVRFKKGPTQFLGASLKSSKKSEIGFHNGGAGTIGNSVGIDLESIASKRREEFAKKHGLGKTDISRKKAIKADPQLYEKALEAGGHLHREIADTLHNHYSEMNPEDLRHHLVSTFLKSDENNPVPYVKVTGRGGYGDKPAMAHTEHHHDNPVTNAMLSAKKITTRRSGAGMIHVLADNRHAFTIQAKHNSTPMSTSMKLIGQPATEVKNETKPVKEPAAPKNHKPRVKKAPRVQASVDAPVVAAPPPPMPTAMPAQKPKRSRFPRTSASHPQHAMHNWKGAHTSPTVGGLDFRDRN